MLQSDDTVAQFAAGTAATESMRSRFTSLPAAQLLSWGREHKTGIQRSLSVVMTCCLKKFNSRSTRAINYMVHVDLVMFLQEPRLYTSIGRNLCTMHYAYGSSLSSSFLRRPVHSPGSGDSIRQASGRAGHKEAT